MVSAIFLNGASSAGKTCIGKSLQDILDQPYLLLGLDTLFQTVPARWAGGTLGALRHLGFEYLDLPSEDEHPVLGLGYGSVGWQMMAGYHRAVVEIVRSGNRVIIDEMLLDERVRDHWLNLLNPFRPILVGVYCNLGELERRERQRAADRLEKQMAAKSRKEIRRESHLGLARWSARRVHTGVEYDIVVDTTDTSSLECAMRIRDTMRGLVGSQD